MPNDFSLDVGEKGTPVGQELNHRAAVAVRHSDLPLFVEPD